MPTSPQSSSTFSVIIPVRNGAHYLRNCLDHLSKLRFPSCEIIVIDDNSTDDEVSVVVSEHSGVRYERLDRQMGPSAARNRGARLAKGDYLIFLDADVCVHAHTLRKIAETFASDRNIDAVFGSYDTEPSAPNLISQFRNLLHHYVHQQANPVASTFWAGCGAIKRDVFLELGGFSEGFGRPCIEDIEMGMRAVRSGYNIRLNREVLVKHLKFWSLVNMVKTDTRDRGIPWTRLMLENGGIQNDLNVRHSQRLSTILVFGLMAMALWWVWREPLTLVPIAAIVMGVFGLDFGSQLQGRRFARHAFALLCGIAVCGIVITLTYLQSTIPILLAVVLLLGIVALNYGLYAFFFSRRSLYFAAASLPIHCIYFLVCGVSLATGILLHYVHLSGHVGRPISAGRLPSIETVPRAE